MEHTEHEDWTMRSNYHYLIDAGHGGWLIDDEHPDGYYPTSGKRSPKDPETGETLIYEGVNNRINARLLVKELTRMRISASLLVPEEEDISLGERVRRANKEHKERKCILISIHSNASGSDGKWANAQGNGLYIAKKRSRTTDKLVEIMADHVEHDFQNLTKWRGIKERNFYIITKSNCPAILTEFGFHDNLEEARKLLTDEWRETVVKSVTNSIITFEDER
jgi:N-acetylmuramoyl-L-alanine amidase